MSDKHVKSNRIHHRERMQARAMFIAGQVRKLAVSGSQRDDIVEQYRRNGDNICMCSCSMCCNPRHSGWEKCGGKTRKEVVVEREVREFRREYGL